MSDKSHVSIEQHLCRVCGALFDSGTILLDQRLRASMERRTTTDWGLCPEHQKLFSDGYIALIEFDPERSRKLSGASRMNSESAYRTGKVAHLKRDVFDKIFSVTLEADQACIFAERGVIERLQAMVDTASK